jgi:hypothetical protein
MSKVSKFWIPSFLLLFVATNTVSPAQHTSSYTQGFAAGGRAKGLNNRPHTPQIRQQRFAEDSAAVTELNPEFSSPPAKTETAFTSARQFVDGTNSSAPSRAPPAFLNEAA